MAQACALSLPAPAAKTPTLTMPSKRSRPPQTPTPRADQRPGGERTQCRTVRPPSRAPVWPVSGTMADDFANELVHQAVARLCLHKGVKAAEHRASQALADFTKLCVFRRVVVRVCFAVLGRCFTVCTPLHRHRNVGQTHASVRRASRAQRVRRAGLDERV